MNLQQRIKEVVEGFFSDWEDSANEYAVLCPWHSNTDTPALYINKTTGLFHCWNPACNAKGNFHQLLEKLGLEDAEKYVFGIDVSVEDIIGKLNDLTNTIHSEPAWQDALDSMTLDYSDSKQLKKLTYLVDRGFHTEILRSFEVGFSNKQSRIVIPTRDENFKLVGFIGRAVDPDTQPKYRYSDKFPRSSVLFNLQNAKNYGTVYVTEGSLDAIKVHQAGFPNVVATLGAASSAKQGELLNQYFDDIVIISDADDAGNNQRDGIISMCKRKNLWITRLPDGIKDPGDCTEDQIRETIAQKENYLDYMFKELYTKKGENKQK